MAVESANAPSWLFSFVDLAFLLLIAMTQLVVPDAPQLGEILLPQVDRDSADSVSKGAGAAWQVRVHPPAGVPPFELLPPGVADAGERLERKALLTRIAELRGEGVAKPLLAPHQDSRSQDLLDAATAIEQVWPQNRRATVARRPAQP